MDTFFEYSKYYSQSLELLIDDNPNSDIISLNRESDFTKLFIQFVKLRNQCNNDYLDELVRNLTEYGGHVFLVLSRKNYYKRKIRSLKQKKTNTISKKINEITKHIIHNETIKENISKEYVDVDNMINKLTDEYNYIANQINQLDDDQYKVSKRQWNDYKFQYVNMLDKLHHSLDLIESLNKEDTPNIKYYNDTISTCTSQLNQYTNKFNQLPEIIQNNIIHKKIQFQKTMHTINVKILNFELEDKLGSLGICNDCNLLDDDVDIKTLDVKTINRNRSYIPSIICDFYGKKIKKDTDIDDIKKAMINKLYGINKSCDKERLTNIINKWFDDKDDNDNNHENNVIQLKDKIDLGRNKYKKNCKNIKDEIIIRDVNRLYKACQASNKEYYKSMNKTHKTLRDKYILLGRQIKDTFGFENQVNKEFLRYINHPSILNTFKKSTIFFATDEYKELYISHIDMYDYKELHSDTFKDAQIIKEFSLLFFENGLLDRSKIKVYGKGTSLTDAQKTFINNNETIIRKQFSSIGSKGRPDNPYKLLKWLDIIVREYFGGFIKLNISKQQEQMIQGKRNRYYEASINNNLYFELILGKNKDILHDDIINYLNNHIDHYNHSRTNYYGYNTFDNLTNDRKPIEYGFI
jgi:hypothetical protein